MWRIRRFITLSEARVYGVLTIDYQYTAMCIHLFLGILSQIHWKQIWTQKKTKLIELNFYRSEEDSDVDYCSSKDINELLFGGEVNDDLGEEDRGDDTGLATGASRLMHGVVFGNVRFGQYSMSQYR